MVRKVTNIAKNALTRLNQGAEKLATMKLIKYFDVSGPVERGGLPGLVPVVFKTLVIFTNFQQENGSSTKLELNSRLCISQNDTKKHSSILLIKTLT